MDGDKDAKHTVTRVRKHRGGKRKIRRIIAQLRQVRKVAKVKLIVGSACTGWASESQALHIHSKPPWTVSQHWRMP